MSSARRPRRVRAVALLGTGTLLVGGGLAGLAPGGATASSHREAPSILNTPAYDNTDVYAFMTPGQDPDQGFVNLIANWHPFSEPGGGPNFYPWATDARYNIKIDNDYDAKPDIIYRWTFRTTRTPGPKSSFSGNGTFLYNNGPVTSLKDDNLLFKQKYDLKRIKVRKGPNQVRTLLHNAPVAPSFVGDASMPDYETLRDLAISGFQGAGRQSFVGQAEDPFFLDLRVFDLLYGGNCMDQAGHDSLNGFNVNTIALKVPRRDLIANGRSVIGVWSTTDRKNAGGGYSQISRLGQPLVNEVVIPYRVKDTFNALKPRQDAAALPFVQEPELAHLLKNVCGVNAPTEGRDDLVQVFLTGVPTINNPRGKERPAEYLRLNTVWQDGQPVSRLGVIGGDKNGFPNGRRLQDDVVDIALQVVAGELKGNPNDIGDGVDANGTSFGSDFPFVALPHSGSVTKDSPAAASGSTLPGGPGGGGNGGFPAGEVALIGLGVLALAAGAVAARKAGTSGTTSPAPASA